MNASITANAALAGYVCLTALAMFLSIIPGVTALLVPVTVVLTAPAAILINSNISPHLYYRSLLIDSSQSVNPTIQLAR